jgi:hypothetical protein
VADLTASEKSILQRLSQGNMPSWLLNAFDPKTRLHPTEGAAHTEGYELEDGRQILVPRVRLRNGEPVVLSGKFEAFDEAMRRNDFIVVPKGEDPTEYSKKISSLIGKMRGIDNPSSLRPRSRPKKSLMNRK